MKILVTGGGTGGHIYPALAFVKYMQELDSTTEVLYVGGKKGLENKIVPAAGIDFKTIGLQGFKRSLSPDNFKTVYLFIHSLKKAKQIIREFKPDVVIGTGGYVSGSVMYAAAKMNIPTIIHEQNSVPGITNKFLSRYASAIATSFHGVEEYFPKAKLIEFTGNPRAQEVANVEKSDILAEYNLKPDKLTVVIFGGSQGALKINRAFVDALPHFEGKDYQVLYASGERYYDEFKESFIKAQEKMPNISIQPYINKMAEVLANSSIMIGRSGATSLAEMTALGLPGILIPSPYVTNDHQTKNAQALVDVGAAILIKDDELTGENLVQAIDNVLLNEEKLQLMSKSSKKAGVPNASKRLLTLINKVKN
ncbi:MAG: undecaprenyldiphospho-muramoylpentapeptide beta-N-acetylglucosaminyltransferase [Streptococcaceae bacterium]|jgi:UDP-N-acetylglucosamine--N-acetylmuramyl-(pentapeptide) pyrophosphoryl-undecaprenol N-acetylglucosamine transferase|nr:undecaprenyldiphospho-muramoylpentapeptide beta-N-acetylglucosaminyltransferase [Streptococcaceae bacterium]